MALIIGTREGIYRSSNTELDDTEHVLDSGNSLRVRAFDAVDGVFAATKAGLYRSVDDGETWENLDIPREEVYSVVADPAGDRLYAGTHPAHLYVSEDSGETWTELDGFQDLPSRDEWHTPRHRNEAHVRSLGVHSDAPERVIAGVEVGGVHVGEVVGRSPTARGTESHGDRGETWTERRDGVHDDVHHVLVLGSEEYVASCGGGLYRTRDVGQSWTRLDTDLDHRYFREAFAFDGRLYAAAARGPPGTWQGENGADAVLLESDDGGETFEEVSYPGGPDEFVLAWTETDGTVVAGTNGGRLLVRDDDGTWTDGGTVPAGIRSITVS